MEHDAESSRRYKENWDDAVQASKVDAAALQAHKERWAFKLGEMRHYLNEAHQFAAMSPRGKENIATAMDILGELEAGA